MAGRGRLYKWIVRRNCAVRNLCEEFFQEDYSNSESYFPGIVSHGNIKVAIGSKVKGAAIMIGGCGEGVQLKEDYPTAWQNHIAVGSEPNHTIVCGVPGTV